MLEGPISMLLDSGAFSVWNLGAPPIDVKEYIRFIKLYEKQLFGYVTLDVLPPGAEKHRSAEANEEGARLSDINHRIMKDAGLTPIPVFHQGENFKWLERMLKNGEPVVGISTRKDLPPKSVRDWLDEVWSVLVDGNGRPIVRTHGFGITSIPLLLRYPWWTTDSTTWAMVGAIGCIYVPQKGVDGKPDYSRPPVVVKMSTMSSNGGHEHFDSMGPVMQKWVTHYLEEELGVGLARTRNLASGRQEALLKFYLNMIAARPEVRFTHRRHGLDGTIFRERKIVDIDRFRIMFVVSLHLGYFSNKAMNDAGASTRLMTYYEVRDTSPERIVKYIETGIVNPPRKLKPNWYKEEYVTRRKLSVIGRSGEEEVDGIL